MIGNEFFNALKKLQNTYPGILRQEDRKAWFKNNVKKSKENAQSNDLYMGKTSLCLFLQKSTFMVTRSYSIVKRCPNYCISVMFKMTSKKSLWEFSTFLKTHLLQSRTRHKPSHQRQQMTPPILLWLSILCILLSPNIHN